MVCNQKLLLQLLSLGAAAFIAVVQWAPYLGLRAVLPPPASSLKSRLVSVNTKDTSRRDGNAEEALADAFHYASVSLSYNRPNGKGLP
ncbi:hypothetical protein MRX96_017959 [Rhipicephalus microplus]